VDIDYTPGQGLSVNIDEMVVDLVDFGFDIGNFPDTLEDWLAGIIEDIVEEFAIELGTDLIVDLIEDELPDLDLEGDTSFSGYNLHYMLDPDVLTDGSGITFMSDMQLFVDGTEVDPCVDPGTPVGSRYSANPIGSFGATTPGGNPYQMAIALSDDILNQLIFSIYSKGMLCWGPESIGVKGTGFQFENLLAPMLPNEELKGLMALGWLFSIYPVNPPTIEVGLGANDLSLVIEDMRFDWLLEREGRMVEMVNASFDIELGLDVTMDISNNLIITFNAPTIVPVVHESSFNTLPVADVIDFIATNLIPPLLGLLEDFMPPIPLPGMMGFQLTIDEMGAMGTGNDYLGIYVSVTTPFDLAQSIPPDTRIVLYEGEKMIAVDQADLDPSQSAAYGLNDGRHIVLELNAGGENFNGYFYRIDNSGWRHTDENQITITSLIEGPHTLQVKAINRLNQQDPVPATLSFICDNVPPELVVLESELNRVHAVAWDFVDDQISFRYKLAEMKDWALSPTGDFTVTGTVPGAQTIEVAPMDRAGNIGLSKTTTVFITSQGSASGGSNGDDDGAENSDDDDDDGISYRTDDDESSGGWCGF